MTDVDELIGRLRIKARQASEAAQMMAEAKSLRQESNPEGLTDLYMWPTPEQTAEWQAADALQSLTAENARLTAELTEQARLVGMGSEREARLLARIAELERGHLMSERNGDD